MSLVQELFKIGLVPTAALQTQQAATVADVLEQAGVPCVALKNPSEEVMAAFKNRPNFLVGAYVSAEVKNLVAGVQFVLGNEFSSELQALAQKTNIPLIHQKDLPGGVFALDELLTGKSDWQKNVSLHLKKAVQDMLGFHLRHVGINCQDEAQSSGVADTFERIFGLPKEDRGGAYFAGEIIEVMKKPFYGTHGHIAIATNSAESAAYHLEKAGVKFNWNSAGYNPDGRLRVVYLQDEIGGFAVHILQK